MSYSQSVPDRNATRRAQPFASIVGFCLEVVCLLFPALINRAPLVYPDTRSYYLGGHAAVEKIAGVFAHHGGGAGGDNALAATMQKARGVRSAFYSLFVYIPAISISLWVVIIAQALIVAGMLRLVFGLVCPDLAPWQRTKLIVLLAVVTTVSWVTCNIMPDVFTSVMALAIIVAIIYWQQISSSVAAVLFVVIAGSVVMHLTNLPIALGLVVAGVILAPRRIWRLPRPFALVLGSLALGVLAMLMVGVVGFKQWTLAPQSPPFLLARSLQDGPGRLYLRDHCPQIGLQMCHYLDHLNDTTEKFIWDADGVYSAASPEEEAKLRAEDKRIYIAAALEHPWLQLSAMTRNALLQLVNFGVYEYYIPSWADYDKDSLTLHFPDSSPWHLPISVLEYAVVFGALGFIPLHWREVPTQDRRFTAMIFVTVLLEAAAGAVSEPVPRYEARVIWLIPLAALLLSRKRQSGSA